MVAHQDLAPNGGLMRAIMPYEEDPTVIVQNANASITLGSMLDIAVAQWMMEANTRLIRTVEKIVDTMNHLGELH